MYIATSPASCIFYRVPANERQGTTLGDLYISTATARHELSPKRGHTRRPSDRTTWAGVEQKRHESAANADAAEKRSDTPGFQPGDTSDLADKRFVLDVLWNVKKLHAGRPVGEGWQWLIELEDATIFPGVFATMAVDGRPLAEYASGHLVLKNGWTYVRWRQQWVEPKDVPLDMIKAY